MTIYRLLRCCEGRNGIIGDLYRGDEFLCFTLEPPFRPESGAIPDGRYGLSWAPSPRLEKFTPRLLDVPGRAGILMHAGNVIDDSKGCILLGMGYEVNAPSKDIFLTQSRIARDNVYTRIAGDCARQGHCEITVEKT